MLFNKGPGFAGSLVISIFLHGLILLVADLYWDPGFPGEKNVVQGPVRLAVTIQGPAVAAINGWLESSLSAPAAPVSDKGKSAGIDPGASSGMEKDPGIRITEIAEKTIIGAVTEAESEVREGGKKEETEVIAETTTETETGSTAKTITEITTETVTTETIARIVEETITEAGTSGGREAGTEEVSGRAPLAAISLETVEESGSVTGTGAGTAIGTADTPVPSGNAKTPESSGGTVITRPVAINRNPPVYPPTARANNWEGSVLLDVLILPDGTVSDLRVERSSGYGILDAAALAAVKEWRYRPALKDNLPVACRIKINIRFVLEE